MTAPEGRSVPEILAKVDQPLADGILQVIVGGIRGVISSPLLADLTDQQLYEMALKAVGKGLAAEGGPETMRVVLAAALVHLVREQAPQ